MKSWDALQEHLENERAQKEESCSSIPATGKKYDTGKPRMELLPPEALIQCALVLGMGADKYGVYNWAEGIHTSRLLGAMLRHLNAYNSGETKDLESNLSHIAHVAVTAMFLLHFERFRPDLDDRKKFGGVE